MLRVTVNNAANIKKGIFMVPWCPMVKSPAGIFNRQPIRNEKTNRAPGPSQPAVDADGVELPVSPGKNEDIANGDKL